MDRRYPQRGSTLPLRRISLYQPADLPPGHIPPKRDPPRRRHGAPFGPWPFVDIDEEVDRAQLDDPTHQHHDHLISPCGHQPTGFAQNLSNVSLNAGDEDVVHPHHVPSSSCWCKYPQSLYPNWTQKQQRKSKILAAISREQRCRINYLDMKKDGDFVDGGRRDVEPATVENTWAAIQRGRPSNVHLRMLFVDNCSGPVLKMLGTRYNIEPFFFSSTIGWIPTRFQSNVVQHESDHLTIVFTFMRSISNPSHPNPHTGGPSRARTAPSSPVDTDGGSIVSTSLWGKDKDKNKDKDVEGMVIDTQKPLPLRSNNKLLLLDRLALHMVRCRPSPSSSPASSSTSTSRRLPGNTIISLHPTPEHLGTTAKTMHSRVALTGRSVYWGNVFKAGCRKRPKEENSNGKAEVEEHVATTKKANDLNIREALKDATEKGDVEEDENWEGGDPTFVFLSFLWYATYAWDESLEALYSHICALESEVIYANDLEMTHELHVIQAHLLHFESLLEDFRKTVEFIEDTPNPSMEKVAKLTRQTNDPKSDSAAYNGEVDAKKAEEERAEDARREYIQELMTRECHNLLSEVARLERQRKMMEKRLKNVMDLGFALINIEDSRQTRLLTEASLKDSAAMKQIAYLTMVFLPASFVAAVFGMNVTALAPEVHGTIAHYIEAALPLTALTVWIVIAYQIRIEDAAYHASKSLANNIKDKGGNGLAGGDFKVIDADGNLTEAAIGAPSGGGHQSINMRHSADSWSYTAPGSIGAPPLNGRAGPPGSPGEIQPARHYKRLSVWQRMLWPVTWASNEYEKRMVKADTTDEQIRQLSSISTRKQMASPKPVA